MVPLPGQARWRVVQTLAVAGQELGQLGAGAPGPGRDPRAQPRPHDEVLPVTTRIVARPVVLQPQVVA